MRPDAPLCCSPLAAFFLMFGHPTMVSQSVSAGTGPALIPGAYTRGQYLVTYQAVQPNNWPAFPGSPSILKVAPYDLSNGVYGCWNGYSLLDISPSSPYLYHYLKRVGFVTPLRIRMLGIMWPKTSASVVCCVGSEQRFPFITFHSGLCQMPRFQAQRLPNSH